jgi:hypothetical protein
MSTSASDLARSLAREAEAVCRRYLSNGRREGRYWLVGDVCNTPGRSLFVRLKGGDAGQGAVGKWTDAATGEHGDLLDIIQESCGLTDFREVAAEARRFLAMPEAPSGGQLRRQLPLASRDSAISARRLFAMSQPIAGTIAETYLHQRGIAYLDDVASLRFHPRCYYRPDASSPTESWPAMIAAVTDADGRITGVHRTWLDPSGNHKAAIATPRRAMGQLLGHAVRFGVAQDVMAAGEGIETMLSLRCVMPNLPMAAALSAAHLVALRLPKRLRRLYIARDNDPAGEHAAAVLAERALKAGAEAIVLSPQLGDFNEDLREFGVDLLKLALRVKIAPGDILRITNERVAAQTTWSGRSGE